EHGRGERHPAEDRIVEQDDDQAEGRAQPGIEAALADERYRRVFDREIAQVERLAEREQADEEYTIGLARGGEKEPGRHSRHTMPSADPPQSPRRMTPA